MGRIRPGVRKTPSDTEPMKRRKRSRSRGWRRREGDSEGQIVARFGEEDEKANAAVL